MSRRRGSLAGSPLLIGAVTTLIALVAVFISYNALQGLPFTPTYDIRVQLPTASNLLRGNEVRLDGARIGVVEKLAPQQSPTTGRLTAIAYLKLQKSVEPLPADTRAIVQSVSSVGLKYMRLERGTSRRGIPPGGEIPVAQTREPVDIGEFFDMFDKRTRKANKQNLTNYGNGLVGRGAGLNRALRELRPLVRRATPVLRNLASPQTNFANFWRSLDRAAKEVSPVAGSFGRLYADLDTFFTEWAGAARGLEESIAGGPSSLRQANHSLPFEAKFMRDSAEFMRLLRPSAKALRTAAPPIAHAFKEGAVNFAAAQSLNSEIASSSKALQRFAEDPIVALALEDLTETSKLANPLFAALAAEQARCNYITLTFRNVASLLSQSVGVGTVARAVPVLGPAGVDNESYPASAPANGGGLSPLYTRSNYLHYNPYPSVGAPGQTSVCEAGNQKYAIGKTVIGHVPAGEVGTAGEPTSREENLYGQPYSEETLKALGIGAKGAGK